MKYLLIIFVVFAQCSPAKNLYKPDEDPGILTRSYWKANEPKPYNTHVPVRITIHHEGKKYTATGDSLTKHIRNIQMWGMGTDRNWKDIPYHFLLGLDGSIYEGRNVYTVGETATEYDPTGHLLICCIGSFESQEVSEAMLASLVKLIAYCSKKYNIPYETLASHKDYSTQTNCPGKNLYQYLQNGYLKTEVKKILDFAQ